MHFYFIVFDGFEAVPEIAGIADQVPSDFLVIHVEISQQIVVSPLHGLQVLLGGFFSIGEREYTCDLCIVFEEGAVKLAVYVAFMLEFLSVSDQLDVTDRVDLDLVELKLQTHSLVEI